MPEEKKIIVPADVPSSVEKEYIQNYTAITHGTSRLMLFAADQKIEHLNDDFYGKGLPSEINDPRHIFDIASKGTIGALATHLGLIARYGKQYPSINYIAKLNGKTNLVPTAQHEPCNSQLWTVEQVIELKKQSALNIRGVGCTVYLGSEYEPEMLAHAAQMVFKAHQAGLVTILWMYPRGKAVKDEHSGQLIAGAAGVAASLGSDFVKVTPPASSDGKNSAEWLKVVVQAAGNTKVICSGGKTVDEKSFLAEVYDQLHVGGTAGNATGRNIFTHPSAAAVAMTKAIATLTIENKSLDEALKLL